MRFNIRRVEWTLGAGRLRSPQRRRKEMERDEAKRKEKKRKCGRRWGDEKENPLIPIHRHL